jgi:hypothetical protein
MPQPARKALTLAQPTCPIGQERDRRELQAGGGTFVLRAFAFANPGIRMDGRPTGFYRGGV